MPGQFCATMSRPLAVLLAAVLVLSGCTVGPKYHLPTTASAPAYKELTPDDYPNTDGWKVAQPKDDALHGNWWEIFNDPQLNDLEAQVNVNNQTIAGAAASFFAARALVKEARSQLYPNVTVNPAITNQRIPITTTTPITEFQLPFDASWVPDLWGRIHNTINVNLFNAQASAADLENTRLTIHAEVAVDYFNLRGQDALKQLLDSIVVAYKQSLDLTKVLYDTGIDSDEAVAQAETQLESTQAQDTNLGIARAQFQHALALLVGQPASTFSIPVQALDAHPPAVPLGLPSELLERRPDVASSERLVAQANAQIGVSTAAFYPNLTLSASGGFESLSPATWFTWPSRFWSVGPSLAQSVFDAGLRRATVQHDQAAYDQTVANYRETVLTAFQQVEDSLSALRILSQQIDQQDAAVKSAQRNLQISTDRFRLGIDPYLNVITAQTTLQSNQQTAVNLRIEQMTDSVQLIEALGGGWNASTLPTRNDMLTKTPPSANTIAQ